jgi:hypothetical protein
MAVTLFMRVPELSTERYSSAMALLELDANPAAGMLLHVASEAAGAVNVFEVWQTPEAAESYVERRLRPALQATGVKEALSYRLEPMRNLFAPEMDILERIGSTALPAEFVQRARAS